MKGLIRGKIRSIIGKISSIIDPWTSSSFKEGSVLREHVIKAEGNKWLLKKSLSRSKVSFCIVSLPVPEKEAEAIESSFAKLREQTYRNWKAVYFTNSSTPTAKRPKSDSKLEIANSSTYEGLNLQRAAVFHCKIRDVMVLLDYDESFEAKNSLAALASHFENKKVYAAYLAVRDSSGKAHNTFLTTGRQLYSVNKGLYQSVRNHVRAFNVDIYRWLPPSSLHDLEGHYYDR